MNGAERGRDGPAPRGRLKDAAIALALAVVAFAPRAAGFERLGLTHYDEGVYAESAEAVRGGKWLDGFHPQQHLHAPPLNPVLAGLLSRATGLPASRMLLMLSVVFGAATAPLLFLVVRAAVGRAGGVAAGLLIAGSGAHVLWSGTALTDAAFVFWFVAALGAWAWAERRRSTARAAVFGLLVGCAWNTKYHGVLALVAAFVAAAPEALRRPAERRGLAARLAVASLCSVLSILPWRFAMARLSGGVDVVALQMGRFFEPAHWLRSLLTQAGYLDLCEGPAAKVAALAALAAAVVLRARRGGTTAERATDPGVRVLVAAWALFTLLTPCYHPYARLALPWIALSAAMIGAVWARVFDAATRSTASRVRRRAARAAASCAACGLALAVVLGASTGVADLRASDGLERAARELVASVPTGAPLAVLSEPALNASLAESGRPAARLGRPDEVAAAFPDANEIWVVSGFYVRRNREWQAFERAGSGALVVVGRSAATVGAARRCDDFLPPDVRGAEASSSATYALELRRVVPRR